MSDIVLEMQGISKAYPGVQALDNAELRLLAGEVLCLLGENGAGKSTLMKILAGAETADAGEIRLAGDIIQIESPHHAQSLGISMIYQEFNLSPFLSVAENIFLGREPRRGKTPFIDWNRMHRDTSELLERIHVRLDPRKPVHELSVAQQQMVEIAKALSFDSRIVVMDEPSATLTEKELNGLFDLIRHLKEADIGIVYISHRLDEIFAIGDRVTIMRDGKHISTDPIEALDREAIIHRMVGRDLEEEFPKQVTAQGKLRLEVNGLTRRDAFEDVSLNLHEGEIVGLTGLVGAGRTEVARAIFGADPTDSGTVHLDGEKLSVRNPQDAIECGIGLLTEDRKHQGLVMGMNVRENTTLANLGALSGRWLVNRNDETMSVKQFIEDLEIRTPGTEQAVRNLSGGNQQKVVLAKWLFTKSNVLIFDEPTRGIDVGAKVGIYELMNRLVSEGVCVLMISSELPEILGMCDRILVMHEGRIAGELSRDEATQERIMHLAAGETATSPAG